MAVLPFCVFSEEYYIRNSQENESIEKLMLQVFYTNTGAIQLYKNLGFAEEGRLIRAARQPDGTYVDIIPVSLGTKQAE